MKVWAFGTNPSTDADLDHDLGLFMPLGVAPSFALAKKEIINEYRISITNRNMDNHFNEEDLEEIKTFTSYVKKMKLATQDNICPVAYFIDDHGDYWWIQEHTVIAKS